ncbi:hypothetical protein ILYODFUR_007438 [Ilyodon furcidens]|uniref:Secreted protein n=1 Tax=Ilyodon furcidens TaxID=33524 RepID=A0ABV0VF55_9TELE
MVFTCWVLTCVSQLLSTAGHCRLLPSTITACSSSESWKLRTSSVSCHPDGGTSSTEDSTVYSDCSLCELVCTLLSEGPTSGGVRRFDARGVKLSIRALQKQTAFLLQHHGGCCL